MPSTNQAKKRMRQNDTLRTRNRARKTQIKTWTRKVIKAIEEKDAAEAQTQFAELQKKLDKAAKSRSIHPNKAARRKSRIQKQINALSAKSG